MPSIDGKRLDPDRLTRLGRASAVATAPCGTWLAVAVSRLDREERTYVSNLWRISLVEAASPVPLTRSDCNDTCPRFRSDGALLFLSDRPGDPGQPERSGANRPQRAQVWLLPPGGGEPYALTDEPLGVRDFRVTRTTQRLFVVTDVFLGIPHDKQRDHEADLEKRGPSGLHYTAMPVRHWDHWLSQAAPHIVACADRAAGVERIDLTPDADREHRAFDFGVEWDVSHDGKHVVVSCTRLQRARMPEADLRVIDTASGAHVDLGSTPYTTHTAPCFSPDGDSVACVRTTSVKGKADRVGLWLFPSLRPDDPGRAVVPDWDAWPMLHGWTRDGSALLCTADERGRVPVFRVDVATSMVEPVIDESAGGSHMAIEATPDGRHVVGLRHCLLHPPEPFRVALGARQVPAIVAWMSGFGLSDGQAVARWESIDVASNAASNVASNVAGKGELPVQTFVVTPAHADKPCPTLLWIHGGPMSQWTDGWHWRWNPLVAVSAGYAVILPNPRGSTGFGQKFLDEICGNTWGAGCYRDLIDVTDAVAARPDIDGKRMAAMGGSFGGYMTNWIGGNSERFRCLTTHAGIYSIASFAGATDYPAYTQQMLGIAQHEDLAAFERYSASRRITSWKTPTLIIHGERDYRVPISEALQLFEALIWQGVDAELLVFPDENHWILEPQNIRLWYRTVLDFVAKHL